MLDRVRGKSKLLFRVMLSAALLSSSFILASPDLSLNDVAFASSPSETIYVVQKGDNLWSIARTYGIEVSDLVETNSISDPDHIVPGQKLVIPDVPSARHVVEPGENLSVIASRYGVTVQDLVSLNNIDNADIIMPGQEILIPPPNSATRPDRFRVASRGSERMIWPADGRLSSGFGPRWGKMHEGIDIAGPVGTDIRAAAGGKVIYAGWASGYGRLVIIEHSSNLTTRYGHASRLLVSAGDHVKAGQVIAKIGTSGNVTGSNLHFEVRYKGEPQDPLKWLPPR